MTISSASILAGATAAFTGGTTAALTVIQREAGRAISAIFGGTSFFTNKEVRFSAVAPVARVGTPGGYTQRHLKVRLKVPMVLSNGNKTFNTAELAFGLDPETSDADNVELRKIAAQLILDSDFDGFYLSSSVE